MNPIKISYSVCYKHISSNNNHDAASLQAVSSDEEHSDIDRALLLPKPVKPASKSVFAWYLEDIQKSPTDSNTIMTAYFIFNCLAFGLSFYQTDEPGGTANGINAKGTTPQVVNVSYLIVNLFLLMLPRLYVQTNHLLDKKAYKGEPDKEVSDPPPKKGVEAFKWGLQALMVVSSIGSLTCASAKIQLNETDPESSLLQTQKGFGNSALAFWTLIVGIALEKAYTEHANLAKKAPTPVENKRSRLKVLNQCIYFVKLPLKIARMNSSYSVLGQIANGGDILRLLAYKYLDRQLVKKEAK